MKKIGWILVISLFIFIKDCYALSINEMTIMNLDKVTTIENPDGYISVQGGTTTDKYIITLFINEIDPSYENTALLVLDKETYKVINMENNPITDYNFLHANDATYNSKTNELLVLAGRRIFFLDLENDSFEVKKKVVLKHYYSGLGYDEENNHYVLARTKEEGATIEIMNENFEIINSFEIKTNLTKQSLTVYEGNIYYVCYEAGKVTKYQKTYDGILKRKENVIYVYDLEGNKKNVYYIPYSYRETIFGEIENISFNNGKMIIQFNHTGKAGYFTPEYRKDIFKKVDISIEQEEEKEKIYSLMNNEEEVQRSKNHNNTITYHLRYKEEGSYEYHIETKDNKKVKEKQTEETDIEEPPIIEENDSLLKIKVYYDPLINQLRAESNEKDLIFKEGKLSSINPEEPLIVEVPDTSSNSMIKYLGILIIFLESIYIMKKASD